MTRCALLVPLLGALGCRDPGDPMLGPDGTSTSSSPDDSGTESGPECRPDVPATCPDDRPYCTSGVCLPCSEMGGDTACEGLDPQAPRCDLPSGHCVPCQPGADQCPADRPYCTGEPACVACIDRSDCPDSACNRFTGECMPTDSVVWVRLRETTSPNPPAPDGSPSAPYERLQDALDATTAEQLTVLIPGGGGFHESTTTIEGPRTVVVLGNAIDRSASRGSPTMLLVGPGARVQLEEILVRDHVEPALRCNGGQLWLHDSYVGRGTGSAIDGQDCDLHVQGGQIWDNGDGGIRLSGDSRLTMANTVVALNALPLDPAIALDVAGGSFDISFSTIVANYFEDGPASLRCAEGVTGRVRNSIVSSFAASIECPGLAISHGVVDVDGLGGEGLLVREFEPSWFVALESDWEQLVDAHLTEAGQAAVKDLARWGLGDPLVDVDGEARSGIAGAAEPAGHDRP